MKSYFTSLGDIQTIKKKNNKENNNDWCIKK